MFREGTSPLVVANDKMNQKGERMQRRNNRNIKGPFREMKKVSVTVSHLEGKKGSRIRKDTDTGVYIQSVINVTNETQKCGSVLRSVAAISLLRDKNL